MADAPDSPLMRRIQARLDRVGLNPRSASIKAFGDQGSDFIRNIKRGKSKSPGIDQMRRLAKVLECNVEYLLDDDPALSPVLTPAIHEPTATKDLLTIEGEEFALLPVFDLRFSAGPGAWHGDQSEPLYYEPHRFQWLRSLTNAAPEMLILAKVEGDSMERTLHNGDQVLIDRSRRRANRDGLYGLRRDDELQVKRIAVDLRSGLLTIISDNDQYPRWDGVNPDSIEIIGRVIWLGRQV